MPSFPAPMPPKCTITPHQQAARVRIQEMMDYMYTEGFVNSTPATKYEACIAYAELVMALATLK